MLSLWTNSTNAKWMAITAATTLAILTSCKPPEDSCKDSKDAKGNSKCSTATATSTGTGTSTSTKTVTSTATSTSTNTSGGYNFPSNPGRVCTIDRFKQNKSESGAVKKLDMLFVMDHSGSMADDWARVANNVQELVKELPATADIRYAVLLANASSKKGILYAPKTVDSAVMSNQSMKIQEISRDLHKIFTEGMKQQDSVGSGEASFLSLYSAVTENAVKNQKLGFFRADAALSILFMSDEHEIGSPFPNPQAPGLPPRCDAASEDRVKKEQYDAKGININSTFNAVKKLKGDMPVMTHAFVNITKEDLFKRNAKNSSCLYDSLGYGYFDMVDKTKGVLFSIQDNKAEGLAMCGRVIKQRMELQHEFTLSKPANKVDAATILAAVDAAKVNHEYRVASNSVYLENAGAANSAIEIQYCEPEVRQEWTIQDFTGQAGQYAASLSWKTPEHATRGKIVYGLSANALNNEVQGANGATNHVVTVNGLNANTVYHFQAVNSDEWGVEKRSAVISLRTKPDWAISSLSGQPSRNMVNVSWKTTAYATKGKVRYGAAANALVNETAETAAANDHNVAVEGLNANTTYYVQAVSSDEFGLVKESAVVPVTTLADWGIVGFQGAAARNSVALQWQTPGYATEGAVVWGLADNALNNSAPIAGTSENHAVTVNGLNANTVYYFQAVNRDDLGVEKRSAVISVRTINDWNISDFTGTSTQETVTVNWNTLGYNTNGKVLWGSAPNALSGVVNSAGPATAHSATVGGLSPDTIYYFQAVSNDDLGLVRASAVVAIRTQAKPVDPPVLPEWEISDFDGTATIHSVNVSWKTADYATSGTILWGTSETALTSQMAGGAAVKDHAFTVSGLTADTLYYFQAVSVDDHNQVKRSAVVAIRTLADEPTDPPPVGNWEVQGFDATTTSNSADVIWQTPGAVTKATLMIGLSATDLTHRSIAIDDYRESQLVNVTGLNPSTSYYFKVIAVDKNGRTMESTVLFKRTKD